MNILLKRNLIIDTSDACLKPSSPEILFVCRAVTPCLTLPGSLMDTTYVTSARRLRSTGRRTAAFVSATSNSVQSQAAKGFSLEDSVVRNLDNDLLEAGASSPHISREESALYTASQNTEPNGNVTTQVLSARKNQRWPSRLLSMLCCLVVVSILAVLLVFLYLVLQGTFFFHF